MMNNQSTSKIIVAAVCIVAILVSSNNNAVETAVQSSAAENSSVSVAQSTAESSVWYPESSAVSSTASSQSSQPSQSSQMVVISEPESSVQSSVPEVQEPKMAAVESEESKVPQSLDEDVQKAIDQYYSFGEQYEVLRQYKQNNFAGKPYCIADFDQDGMYEMFVFEDMGNQYWSYYATNDNGISNWAVPNDVTRLSGYRIRYNNIYASLTWNDDLKFDDFYMFDSETRRLTEADLKAYLEINKDLVFTEKAKQENSSEERFKLMLIVNEISFRHGYEFSSSGEFDYYFNNLRSGAKSYRGQRDADSYKNELKEAEKNPNYTNPAYAIESENQKIIKRYADAYYPK